MLTIVSELFARISSSRAPDVDVNYVMRHLNFRYSCTMKAVILAERDPNLERTARRWIGLSLMNFAIVDAATPGKEDDRKEGNFLRVVDRVKIFEACLLSDGSVARISLSESKSDMSRLINVLYRDKSG